MEFNRTIELITQMNQTVIPSPEECGIAIRNFSNWFTSLTPQEKQAIIIDYFKNPPYEEDEEAIKEFANRHPNASILSVSQWLAR